MFFDKQKIILENFKILILEPEYALYSIFIKKGFFLNDTLITKNNGFFYVDKGQISVDLVTDDCLVIKHMTGDVFNYGSENINEIYAIEDSLIYIFRSKRYTGKYQKEVQVYEKYLDGYVAKTYDNIKKYWGNIFTIVNSTVCGKIINMNPNTQSSLEYHTNKKESYYLVDGILDIGVRIGKTKNFLINLKKNTIFTINPGLMHMRIARTKCKIVEISTYDNPSDTCIVEDGRIYKHIIK